MPFVYCINDCKLIPITLYCANHLLFYYLNLYMNYNFIKKCSHYGDILAIPFFALLVFYFYNIEDKSTIEYILLFFSISGFILDIIFTYVFLSHFKSRDS